MLVPYDNSGYSNYFLTPTVSSAELFLIPVGRWGVLFASLLWALLYFCVMGWCFVFTQGVSHIKYSSTVVHMQLLEKAEFKKM